MKNLKTLAASLPSAEDIRLEMHKRESARPVFDAVIQRGALITLRFPVGRDSWRDATPDEFAKVQSIADKLEDEY